MYNTKIDDELINNARKAIENDELYEYFVGVGNYKFYSPESYWAYRNDMFEMICGLELYRRYRSNKSDDISRYLSQQLMAFACSDDIDKVFVSLDFVCSYIFLHKSEQEQLSVDVLSIIQLLKNSVKKLEAKMRRNKTGDFSGKGGMWRFVEIFAGNIAIYTGEKIL